jgi:hypothetical protein
MRYTSRAGRALVLGVSFALSACASTTVTPVSERTIAGLPPPELVLVYRFAISASEVTPDQGFFQSVQETMGSTPLTVQQQQTAWTASNRLADDMVREINGLGLFAQRGGPGMVVPPNSLIISGAFIDVDQGNRTEQLVIGFGLGGSSIDTRMRVQYYSDGIYRTLGDFAAHTDSGELPGAAMTMGAGAAAQGGLTIGTALASAALTGGRAYESSLDPMIDRIADKSVVTLSQFFAQEGWIQPNMVKLPSWRDL